MSADVSSWRGQMNHVNGVLAVWAVLLLANGSSAPASQPAFPQAPPQNQGRPYTRSARPRAMEAIKDCTAVFAGSRYGYAHGLKVRLLEDTPEHMLHVEAMEHEGHVFVPESFVGILTLKDGKADPAPSYLAEKWVASLPRPSVQLPPSVPVMVENGIKYVDFAAAAEALGLKVAAFPRGLVLAADHPIRFSDADADLFDDVVTLFDTPDKLADPDVATRNMPLLKLQGKWTDHVKATPEQLKLLEGPETEWPKVPTSEYDLSGFNQQLLGTQVPAPGVYPRLLFSEQDLPMLAARMKENKLAQKSMIEWQVLFEKSWWDPKTSDGQAFVKLATGETADLQWPEAPPGTLPFQAPHGTFRAQKPGIYTSHVNYITNCLTTMALYCLLTGDDAHGRQAACAVANYYRLIEPIVDQLNACSDSELGLNFDLANFSQTGWRGMHGVVAHMDLGLALDFAGKWMTPEQKDGMRRFIAKATYGRRDNMQAAPDRVKDINHMTWHLTNFMAASAIEGLEGCDPEVLEAGKESARAFLDWGIDKYGQIFESNGKSGGGIQFEILSMVVLARRGDNLWGHPHWRKLLDAQVQCTSPDGKATVSSGTWGASPFVTQSTDEIKAFYPQNLAADYLLTQDLPELDLATFDPAAYRAALQKNAGRVRLPGPSYPGLAFTGIYDADWKHVTRADVKLPLTFDDDVHGILSAFGDATPDASWLCLHVRANQYIGSGHHHADVGMFYMSGLGVNWVTEPPFVNNYDGKYYNEVLIDGIAEPDGLPAVGKYLGAHVSALADFGTVDQTRSYSYKWVNQIQLWEPHGDSVWDHNVAKADWELETDPLPISVYKGTQHYKSRPWWPSYVFSNWLPVLRIPWNPVKYAFRSAGLVRGAHPYTAIVDDEQKDEQPHLYQWTAVLGSNVWQAEVPGLAAGQVALASRSADAKGKATFGGPPLPVRPGEPLLLVCALAPTSSGEDHLPLIKVETANDGPLDRKGNREIYDRLSVNVRGAASHFKVLMIPLRSGDPLPTITAGSDGSTAHVEWKDQKDTFDFTTSEDGRTRVRVERDGAEAVAF